jgi:hypothetical protein
MNEQEFENFLKSFPIKPEYISKIENHMMKINLLEEINKFLERKEINGALQEVHAQNYIDKKILEQYKEEHGNDIFRDDRGRIIDVNNISCISFNIQSRKYAIIYKKKEAGKPKDCENHTKLNKTYDKNRNKIQENIIEINNIRYKILFYYKPPYEFKQINKRNQINILDIIVFYKKYMPIIMNQYIEENKKTK